MFMLSIHLSHFEVNSRCLKVLKTQSLIYQMVRISFFGQFDVTKVNWPINLFLIVSHV